MFTFLGRINASPGSGVDHGIRLDGLESGFYSRLLGNISLERNATEGNKRRSETSSRTSDSDLHRPRILPTRTDTGIPGGGAVGGGG
jgi:hypothetical protein